MFCTIYTIDQTIAVMPTKTLDAATVRGKLRHGNTHAKQIHTHTNAQCFATQNVHNVQYSSQQPQAPSSWRMLSTRHCHVGFDHIHIQSSPQDWILCKHTICVSKRIVLAPVYLHKNMVSMFCYTQTPTHVWWCFVTTRTLRLVRHFVFYLTYAQTTRNSRTRTMASYVFAEGFLGVCLSIVWCVCSAIRPIIRI